MSIYGTVIQDYVGFVLLEALLYSSRISRSNKQPELRIFSMITIMTMVACVVDSLSFLVDGRPGLFMRVVGILTNTFCFAVNPIFIASWCLYEDLKLYKSKARVKRIYTYAFIPAIVLVAIALINMFLPIIFYLDENNVYHRLPFNYAFYMVDIGYVLFSIYIYKSYEKRYGKPRFFPLFIMLSPILLGCGIQVLFYGVSLIWVSMG
ncbi:MAG: hypothetical protein J5959_01525, partial [Butyrivibrio sp.]|nr:hypothetical protein [Butyrivibrio sp.]